MNQIACGTNINGKKTLKGKDNTWLPINKLVVLLYGTILTMIEGTVMSFVRPEKKHQHVNHEKPTAMMQRTACWDF